MPAPSTAPELVDLVRKSKLVEPARLDAYLAAHPGPYESPAALAARLQAAGLLTAFHVEQLLRGKHRRFVLGRYRILDRIGLGGMGQVFLAEHTTMKRRVALKVMPPDRAENPYSRERFFREARAAAQLDHPNLVRAFDVDQDGDVIFLVMEYVDGISLQDLVARHGPLDPARAAHYLWQAALGLGFLADRGLVHRDIKPSNLLVDRAGVVKVLDLGLVRSEAETDELTRGEGVKILGTADYLAPEQAIDCSKVDVRADIYGLGATGYFLLTGRPPFGGTTAAQKLIAHQAQPLTPAHQLRREVPQELSAVVSRMLEKKPADRYQDPAEVLAALDRWAHDPPPPPTEEEIPLPSTAGVVDLNLKDPRAARTGSSSLSLVGSAGGRSVAHHPAPGRSRPGAPAFQPPALPAAATHQPPALPAVVGHRSPEAERPPVAPRPEPGRPADRPGRLRQRLWLAAAFLLTLAVAAWDVALLTGSVRPDAIRLAVTSSVQAPDADGQHRAGTGDR